MTKRKAIEAAVEVGRIGKIKGCGVEDHFDPYAIANRGYDEGFFAGMLHGAKRSMAYDGGWKPHIGLIQREARALAKKARAK